MRVLPKRRTVLERPWNLPESRRKSLRPFSTRLLYAKLLLSGRLAEGKGEVRVAISLSFGENPKAYALLSKIYHDEGSLDSCERVVDYALSKFPINPELLCMQGILQEYKGRFDEAENTYRRVLAIRPGFSTATESLLSLGQKSPPGRMESGRLSPRDQAKVACDILELLVSRYPDNLPLREALGIAYLKGRNLTGQSLNSLKSDAIRTIRKSSVDCRKPLPFLRFET